MGARSYPTRAASQSTSVRLLALAHTDALPLGCPDLTVRPCRLDEHRTWSHIGPSHGYDVVVVEWVQSQAALFSQACKRLRTRMAPVVALVNPGDDPTLVLALGADTWQTKPACHSLLTGQTIAYRRNSVGESVNNKKVWIGYENKIWVDMESGCLRWQATETPLPHRQAELLAFFLRHPGQLLTRDRLRAEVWRWDFDPETNVVDVYVHYLRKVLRSVGCGGEILTVRGRGYRWVLGDPCQADGRGSLSPSPDRLQEGR